MFEAPSEGGQEESEGAEFLRVEPVPTGATLTGRVISLDGAMDLGAVRVALWAERISPDCQQFAVAGPRSIVLRVVRATSDGNFAVEGLDPGTRYNLRAGGGGRASLWLPEPVTPGGDPVTLELARVKALRVELVSTDGAPPRTPPELLDDGLVLGGSEVSRVGGALEPWEQELVGIPGIGCAPDVSPHGRLVVFSSPPQHPTVGPVSCYALLPGYQEESPTYWAQTVTDRVPIEKLILRPSTPRWGAIEFEFAGLSEAVRDRIAEDEPFGELHLRFEGFGAHVVQLIGPAAILRFDGLPVGQGLWCFESYDGYCRRPIEGGLAPFQIGEQVSRVTIDLSRTGGVLVELDPASRFEARNLHHVTITSGTRFPLQLPAQHLPRLFLLVESGEWQQTAAGALDPKTQAMTFQKLVNGPSVKIEPGEIASLRVVALRLQPDSD